MEYSYHFAKAIEGLIYGGIIIYVFYLIYTKLIAPIWIKVFKSYSYQVAWWLFGLFCVAVFFALIVETYSRNLIFPTIFLGVWGLFVIHTLWKDRNK